MRWILGRKKLHVAREKPRSTAPAQASVDFTRFGTSVRLHRPELSFSDWYKQGRGAVSRENGSDYRLIDASQNKKEQFKLG